MPDYQNGKIYQIVCSETGEKYIGSTTQSLALRKGQHVNSYKYWKNSKGLYTTSFKIIEREAFRIELIEIFSCNNREELHAREGHYIRNSSCVNKCTPGRTEEMKTQYQEGYRENHKEEAISYRKKYRAENPEKLKEKGHNYWEKTKENQLSKVTCECGCVLANKHLTRHKKSNKHLKLIS